MHAFTSGVYMQYLTCGQVYLTHPCQVNLTTTAKPGHSLTGSKGVSKPKITPQNSVILL